MGYTYNRCRFIRQFLNECFETTAFYRGYRLGEFRGDVQKLNSAGVSLPAAKNNQLLGHPRIPHTTVRSIYEKVFYG